MKEETEKLVYVQEVTSVYADKKTGEVHYTCKIEDQTVHVIMDLYEALHLHDKEYLKTVLIQYINEK